LHLLLLCNSTLLLCTRWYLTGSLLLPDTALGGRLLDHLIRQHEVELRYRDEPICFHLLLFLFLSRFRPLLWGFLEEQDARVYRFEILALYRGSVFTDNLHCETPVVDLYGG